MRTLSRSAPFTLALLALPCIAAANGVCFWDPSSAAFLTLRTSDVTFSVQNQVAVVTTTQEFHNATDASYVLSYGFPLPEGASATSLAWLIGDEWQEANLSAAGPGSLPGGGETYPALESYLGDTPLVFYCTACDTVPPDSSFAVRLTYVTLLPYAFGEVRAAYPNDYELIQSEPLEAQRFHMQLSSLREIELIELESHVATTTSNDGSSAEIVFESFETVANTDYLAVYRLSLDELGLFGMSVWFDAADLPDELGSGFFTFIAEPQPDTSAVLDKVFTLIVDRSGSMSGSKIVQARAAATFIIDNLNADDEFNIVDFASDVSSFAPDHVPYTEKSRDEAKKYVSTLLAQALTNISGAFSVAVPQFSAASDETANIIIFFTDGKPTTGIAHTENLLRHVRDLISSPETEIYLFVLGIGEDVNTSLLSRMASQNDGFARFLGDDEVAEVITAFYLRVRNPVLLNTEITFAPADVVSEVYPDPLPNLYQGSQMIVSGRYEESGTVEVTLSGRAFGPVSYTYDLVLEQTLEPELAFLPKLWAKSKIEHLLIAYFAAEDPQEQEALRAEIIELSLAYGVLSPFTSFTDEDPDVPIEDEAPPDEVAASVGAPYKLLGNRPNPFNPRTTISFVVTNDLTGPIFVRIYDVRGRFVRELIVIARGSGVYEVVWDGTYADGRRAPSGAYLYTIDFGDAVLGGKMLMVN